VDFFEMPQTLKVLDKLSRAGLKMKEEKKVIPKTPVFGKTFVLTGALKDYSRLQSGDMIKKLGGLVTSSVSKNTDFVLAGDEPGSKYDKALKLGVKIINEDNFKKMVRGL
jgi:DNA ligase (NAD+)